MLVCWQENPDDRPSFKQCKSMISDILEKISPAAYEQVSHAVSKAWQNLTIIFPDKESGLPLAAARDCPAVSNRSNFSSELQPASKKLNESSFRTVETKVNEPLPYVIPLQAIANSDNDSGFENPCGYSPALIDYRLDEQM
jgi:hypothetical protein